jgi:hypothetical protein
MPSGALADSIAFANLTRSPDSGGPGVGFSGTGTWVQSWVQLEGLFQPILVRKLRQINESLIGYEPEGRELESLRRTIVPSRGHALTPFVDSAIGVDGETHHHAEKNSEDQVGGPARFSTWAGCPILNFAFCAKFKVGIFAGA